VRRMHAVVADDLLDLDEFYADVDRRRRERGRRAPRGGRSRRRRRRSRELPGLAEVRHLDGFPAGRLLVRGVGALALLTVVGLMVLWPGTVHHHGPSQSFGAPTQTARVIRAERVRCAGPAVQECRRVLVSVAGTQARITLGPVSSTVNVSPGESIRVSRTRLQAGVAPPPGYEAYQFVDLDRQGALLELIVGLGVLALLLLWWRGLLAMLGVALSLLILIAFVIPALLTGEPALLVALVGALAVMFVTLVLTNGIGAQTLAAALGISSTLLLTAVLATIWIGLAHLDGHSSDISLYLSQQDRTLSLRGVVLAGMIVGALGVLADTAVTQASAVMALRRANPATRPWALYRGALTVGRDHLSATIHTLVLAYAGASLPLLLAMRASGLGAADALNSQAIAEPIVATAIGCVALIAAVPLTTGLASLLVARLPADVLGEAHAHHH
jgi:uncharacterized membrane protein